MLNINDLFGDVQVFLGEVITTLGDDGIDVSGYELDHICYRVQSVERYQNYQRDLSTLGVLLSEAEIYGRKISTYKLAEPICFSGRKIYLVEIPSPKKSSPYAEGLEHAEFVIPEGLEAFVKRYPCVKFDVREMNMKSNPSIKIKYEYFSVKFHPRSLEDVIRAEQ